MCGDNVVLDCNQHLDLSLVLREKSSVEKVKFVGVDTKASELVQAGVETMVAALQELENRRVADPLDFWILLHSLNKRVLRSLMAHLSEQANSQTHHLNKPDYWLKVNG